MRSAEKLDRALSRLAPVHFWLSAVSGIGLFIGLFFLLAGNESAEPVAAVSSIGFYASFALFAVIALKALWKPARNGVFRDGTVRTDLLNKSALR